MYEQRDLVNTNHILSSLTPQKERPSLGSFISDSINDYKQSTRIQPLHYRPGASSFVSPKTIKNPLTPAAVGTMNILKGERNASVRQSGTSTNHQNRDNNAAVYIQTLNGLQQNIKPEEIIKTMEDHRGFWAGNVIQKKEAPPSLGGAFARRLDLQGQWQEKFYKGGAVRVRD